MIPLRDTVQTRTYPVVNTMIIAANVLAYLVEMAQGDDLNRFLFLYGLVPARYSIPQFSVHFTFFQQVFSFFSFMFLHGGFWHLLGNMWSLYIFGDNIEDRLGPLRYALFYVLCGIASGLSHLVLNWSSQVPTIGASGAIAGVMGAYFILFPRSKILTLIPIFFIPYFLELPAYFFLGIWFLLQFISAAGTPSHGGGIAWWAHIGGFIFGIIFLKLFLKIPGVGVTHRIQDKTTKRTTHRLQVIRPTGKAEDPHLRGFISITPREARLGTKKMVNIPWGFQKRLFMVKIPPGVRQGTLLRLSGMGKRMQDGGAGDLYLNVNIEDDAATET
jgi:membrane associated rhomboid family serine protease